MKNTLSSEGLPLPYTIASKKLGWESEKDEDDWKTFKLNDKEELADIKRHSLYLYPSTNYGKDVFV